MTLQVPTILIGLGGNGSTMTNQTVTFTKLIEILLQYVAKTQIYEKLPEERRKKVAMHVFDTDVNTLSKFDHIRKFKTQTSSSKTPREYIAGDPTIPEWFPMDPTILDKPLTEGAGR